MSLVNNAWYEKTKWTEESKEERAQKPTRQITFVSEQHRKTAHKLDLEEKGDKGLSRTKSLEESVEK